MLMKLSAVDTDDSLKPMFYFERRGVQRGMWALFVVGAALLTNRAFTTTTSNR